MGKMPKKTSKETIEKIKGVIKNEKRKEMTPSHILNKEDTTDDEMTEYEKLRQRNIEEREAMMRELKIQQLKEEASKAAGIYVHNDGKYVATKRGLAAQPRSKEILPPGKSLRLQNTPQRKKKYIFKKIFDATFKPSDVCGTDVILASDSEGDEN